MGLDRDEKEADTLLLLVKVLMTRREEKEDANVGMWAVLAVEGKQGSDCCCGEKSSVDGMMDVLLVDSAEQLFYSPRNQVLRFRIHRARRSKPLPLSSPCARRSIAFLLRSSDSTARVKYQPTCHRALWGQTQHARRI